MLCTDLHKKNVQVGGKCTFIQQKRFIVGKMCTYNGEIANKPWIPTMHKRVFQG